MKKALTLIFYGILLSIIICVVSYNPWFEKVETRLTNDGSCAYAGGKYYWLSGDRLFTENGKELLEDYTREIVPLGDNLLMHDGSTVWVYDTANREKSFLANLPDVLHISMESDYTEGEAFVFGENDENGYIIRGSTGEIFSGGKGETTEKDGFLYNFNHPCTVTTPEGTVLGLYRTVLKTDVTVYDANIYGMLLIDNHGKQKAVSTSNGYYFSPENIFSEDEKVFVLAQYRNESGQTKDQLFELNPSTLELEKSGRTPDGRIVSFKNGIPLIFKDGYFLFEEKEISRMPMKTRCVKTVVCENRVFVFGKDNNMIHYFEF